MGDTKRKKLPPIKSPPMWAPVDTDGSILCGLAHTDKDWVSRIANGPLRRVVRLYWREVRKAKVKR